jgi:exonuclease SbcC
VALEIDESSCCISSLANDLLRNCYGPRFSIRFETQSEKLNGESKEDFDITVFDSETGEQKSITDLSGGQTTWVNDALTRAICLYNIQASGRPFGTLFSDELDGALDAGKKI